MVTEQRLLKIKRVLQHRQPDLTVVIENISDPHNVSAILRTCDAVGVGKVHLVYTVEKFPDISKKSSASAKKWIEIEKHKSLEECYEKLHKKGFKIIATAINEKSKDLYDFDLTEKVAIVMGNEHRGVSEEAQRLADHILQIPMWGMIQSLNVSVATAVILYEAARQRKNKYFYSKIRLSQSEYNRLFLKWTNNNTSEVEK